MAEEKKQAKPEKQEAKVATFSVDTILSSLRFANRRDILKVLLNPKEKYSIEQVEKLIKEFEKGTVK